jgi:hypothetical protein
MENAPASPAARARPRPERIACEVFIPCQVLRCPRPP